MTAMSTRLPRPTRLRLLASCVVFACLLAAVTSQAAGRSRMYRGLEPKKIHSTSTIEGANASVALGTVLQGDLVHHDILIPNDGSEVLEIRNLKMCSGCMLDGFSEQIAPGHTGNISMVIPTDALGGQTIESTITADTNRAKAARVEITVSLTIKEFASVSPYRVWLEGRVGEKIVATSLVVPNEAYPFSITQIRARKGVWFEHGFVQVERDGRRAFEITLTNTRGKPGPYQDVLFVQTDHPERPEFRIRVEGRIAP